MKAYEIVLAGIEEKILAGELHVGSILPGERDLASHYGVSRTAVREALRTLATQGLIKSNVGAGPKSGTYITDRHGQAFGKLLQMHVALEQFNFDDVVEARVMLERHSVSLMARNATPKALAELEELLVKMEEIPLELDDFNELDTQYHVAISQLCNNPLITVLTSAVRQSLAKPIRQASTQMADWQEFRKGLLIQHREVFEAIKAGDEDRAADRIENHIRTAYAILPMTKQQ